MKGLRRRVKTDPGRLNGPEVERIGPSVFLIYMWRNKLIAYLHKQNIFDKPCTENKQFMYFVQNLQKKGYFLVFRSSKVFEEKSKCKE